MRRIKRFKIVPRTFAYWSGVYDYHTGRCDSIQSSAYLHRLQNTYNSYSSQWLEFIKHKAVDMEKKIASLSLELDELSNVEKSNPIGNINPNIAKRNSRRHSSLVQSTYSRKLEVKTDLEKEVLGLDELYNKAQQYLLDGKNTVNAVANSYIRGAKLIAEIDDVAVLYNEAQNVFDKYNTKVVAIIEYVKKRGVPLHEAA